VSCCLEDERQRLMGVWKDLALQEAMIEDHVLQEAAALISLQKFAIPQVWTGRNKHGIQMELVNLQDHHCEIFYGTEAQIDVEEEKSYEQAQSLCAMFETATLVTTIEKFRLWMFQIDCGPSPWLEVLT
jgi:uncharacterized membrane protein